MGESMTTRLQNIIEAIADFDREAEELDAIDPQGAWLLLGWIMRELEAEQSEKGAAA